MRSRTGLALAALSLSPLSSAAQYASLTATQGEVHVERPGGPRIGPGWPLAAGDRLYTGEDGFAGLGLSDGTRLWLGPWSELRLVDTGSPARVELPSGSLEALSVPIAAGATELLRVDFPGGGATVLGPGRLRVSASADLNQVRLLSGIAEVEGDGLATLLHAGERTALAEGEAPETAWLDEQDWTDDLSRRVEEALAGPPTAELPPALRPWQSSLDRNGTWRRLEPTGPLVWLPHAGPGWQPYADGYWVSYPEGLTWVAAEPWGYPTHHFGSWEYAPGLGWYWLPGSAWGPAWVEWYVYDDVVGWCPGRAHHHDHRGGSRSHPGLILVPRARIAERSHPRIDARHYDHERQEPRRTGRLFARELPEARMAPAWRSRDRGDASPPPERLQDGREHGRGRRGEPPRARPRTDTRPGASAPDRHAPRGTVDRGQRGLARERARPTPEPARIPRFLNRVLGDGARDRDGSRARPKPDSPTRPSGDRASPRQEPDDRPRKEGDRTGRRKSEPGAKAERGENRPERQGGASRSRERRHGD